MPNGCQRLGFLIEYIGFSVILAQVGILKKLDSGTGHGNWERSHRGLVRWFAKPVKESNPFGGSNPPLSATKSQGIPWDFLFMVEYDYEQNT